MNQPETPDIPQVLKHTSWLLTRHIIRRLALSLALMALPPVLFSLGAPNTFFLALPIPVGMWLLLFLALRLRHGWRLNVCKKVLHTYPLEHRTRVVRKHGDGTGTEWKYLGTIHTIKLSSRGSHGAPRMRAVNATTMRRWPEGADDGGAWFAGDPIFGGVMIVPGAKDMMFMQPANWQKYAQARAQAEPARIERAQRAGIAELVERDPIVGGWV
ncbi:hypothetical protein ACOKM5_12485 [Streptomyces sp. BH097]|uniref:hypothetical protein n=1 Tax=unclassified Streptomyces TaxID=2593676 RepID=UPI003BB58D27